MSILEVTQFSANGALEVASFDNLSKDHSRFIFGTHIQEKEIFQLVSEVGSIINSNTDSLKLDLLSSSNLKESSKYHVSLSRSPFGPNGLSEYNVVEYVQTHFPASQATPDFQKKIEAEFLKFEEIFKQGMVKGGLKGTLSSPFGWVTEEQEHEDIKGEKAKSFFVLRGWGNMTNFDLSVKTEEFKEAFPILMGWNAPFNMWHIETKSVTQ